jgi:hypothetical protein
MVSRTRTCELGFNALTKCGSAALIASIKEPKSTRKFADNDLALTPPGPPLLRPGFSSFTSDSDWVVSSNNLEINFSLLPC